MPDTGKKARLRVPMTLEVKEAFKVLKERYGRHVKAAEALGYSASYYKQVKDGWTSISPQMEEKLLALAKDTGEQRTLDRGLTLFKKGKWEVRAINKDGELWFVAADICGCIGTPLKDLPKFLGREEYRPILDTIDTLDDKTGIRRYSQIVSESGLYSLILKSRKEETKEFKKWVTHKMIPAIRKKESYSLPSGQAPSQPPLDMVKEVVGKAIQESAAEVIKAFSSELEKLKKELPRPPFPLAPVSKVSH